LSGPSHHDARCSKHFQKINDPPTTIMTTEQREEGEHNDQHQDDGGVGLIASGLAWVDKQREKRRREHLQIEAEKQFQKIAQAERARKGSSSIGNSVAGNWSRSFDTSTSDALSTLGSADFDDGGETAAAAAAAAAATATTNNNNNQYNNQKQNQSISVTSDVSESGGVRVDLSDVLINDADIPYEDIIPPVRVTPVDGDENSPYVLNADQMHAIAKHVLPETIMYCRWRRLYGLGRDGDSFDGCIRLIGTSKRTLMVVKTTRGEIFGGYADEPWHSRNQHATAKFYGSASSALFSFSSQTASGKNKNANPIPIDVYRWTGKNRYIQVCDVSSKMLAFGGGGNEGSFGLCLQEDFQRGTTGHCDTFDNEPLCEEGNFDVVDVEFWEFLTGVF